MNVMWTHFIKRCNSIILTLKCCYALLLYTGYDVLANPVMNGSAHVIVNLFTIGREWVIGVAFFYGCNDISNDRTWNVRSIFSIREVLGTLIHSLIHHIKTILTSLSTRFYVI